MRVRKRSVSEDIDSYCFCGSSLSNRRVVPSVMLGGGAISAVFGRARQAGGGMTCAGGNADARGVAWNCAGVGGGAYVGIIGRWLGAPSSKSAANNIPG